MGQKQRRNQGLEEKSKPHQSHLIGSRLTNNSTLICLNKKEIADKMITR